MSDLLKKILKNVVFRFIMVGFFLQALRMAVFAPIEHRFTSIAANIVSIVIATLVAFLLHAKITWADRPGTFFEKIARFGSSIGVSAVLRAIVYPLVLTVTFLECPFDAQINWTINMLNATFPTLAFESPNWLTCDLLSATLMDGVFAFFDFFLHDRWSFKKQTRTSEFKNSQLAHIEIENWC